MSVRVEPGDMLEVIPRLVAEGVVCDAVCTDPPYHLTDHKNKFKGRCAELVGGVGDWNQGAMGRLARGFMGQQWDGGDIAFRSETWAAVYTILRPGAFLIAFGGTRTYHRLVTAIEDAGFIIQDQVAWMFGSGFPKRRDMLKPAFEPVCLAYKPGGKRTMQVDECRIITSAQDAAAMERCNTPGSGRMYASESPIGTFIRSNGSGALDTKAGRWPANVCHDGSEEVTEAFAAFGESGSGSGIQKVSGGNGLGFFNGGRTKENIGTREFGDSGSPARFFYSSKANLQDRWGSRHPTVKPVELMKWLVSLVTPKNGTVLDCFAGSGTTGVAALATGRNAILIEREQAYLADIKERLAFYEGGGTHSVQAKNRSRKTDAGPLFAEPEYDAARDSALSYDAAIAEIGRRVKAGAPIPTTGYFGPRGGK